MWLSDCELALIVCCWSWPQSQATTWEHWWDGLAVIGCETHCSVSSVI